MKRKYLDNLILWKDSANKKPLLIYGARQVGKTYLVKEFGKEYFDNLIYINFESNLDARKIFEGTLDIVEIIKNLEILFQEKISENKTLIFFDEVQECSKALTSFKYFCESEKNYNVIGAGSLLGVHIKENNYSFPVGKVDFLNMYPLSFDEFLSNTKNDLLLESIKESFYSNVKLPNVIHEKAISLYEDYLAVGGMPEVVSTYINTNSIMEARDVQSKIINSYRSDTLKYADAKMSNKIILTYESIPLQLAKDNKKFQYKVVQKGGTSSIFGDSITWLLNSGVVIKCTKAKSKIPLSMHEEIDSFKIYTTDCGLLMKMSNFPVYLIKNRDEINVSVIGSFVENFVASQFKFNDCNLNYWQNDATSEVDFLLQSQNGYIVPVEVKMGDNVKSRSLSNYINEYEPKLSIRISKKNFGLVNNIKSVPLYAAYLITDKSLDESIK